MWSLSAQVVDCVFKFHFTIIILGCSWMFDVPRHRSPHTYYCHFLLFFLICLCSNVLVRCRSIECSNECNDLLLQCLACVTIRFRKKALPRKSLRANVNQMKTEEKSSADEGEDDFFCRILRKNMFFSKCFFNSLMPF